jgi:hypothetical protein
MAVAKKSDWRQMLARHRYNCTGIVYCDRGERKTINTDDKVIDFRVIRNEVIKMRNECSVPRMTAKSFVRRLTRRLKISGYQLGRICEARVFKLYLRLFYLAVERVQYYCQREVSAFFHHLYFA